MLQSILVHILIIYATYFQGESLPTDKKIVPKYNLFRISIKFLLLNQRILGTHYSTTFL